MRLPSRFLTLHLLATLLGALGWATSALADTSLASSVEDNASPVPSAAEVTSDAADLDSERLSGSRAESATTVEPSPSSASALTIGLNSGLNPAASTQADNGALFLSSPPQPSLPQQADNLPTMPPTLVTTGAEPSETPAGFSEGHAAPMPMPESGATESQQAEGSDESLAAESIDDSAAAEPILTIAPVGDAHIPADQRSTITFAGQITVANVPIQRDVVVTLTATAGQFVGADYDLDLAGFQVFARQGQFEFKLRSGLEAQQVRLRAAVDGKAARGIEPDATLEPVPDLEAYTEAVFVTNLRPALVSGLVEFRLGPGATDYWGSFREFLAPNMIGTTEFDLDAALFGTGTLGEWSITGAFDSDRALNEVCEGNRLFRDLQACERDYPTYGDSSQVDYLTPSIDSFYLRLQRESHVPGAEPDYLMWGDYTTAEFSRTSQEFTAMVRQLHGFKGNYTLGPLQFTVLYANNLRPFQRDTIAPNGTSGYYFLSKRLVLAGSEDIFIETEELNRPGTVISRVRLSRGVDYDIDYDRGTLLFRNPVFATDADAIGATLVRRIVATYQVDGNETGGTLYGGRLQYHFEPGVDDRGWLGMTALREDLGAQNLTLVGMDAFIPLGTNGHLIGEIAGSTSTIRGISQSGSAYRFEATGTLLPNILGRAYLRSATTSFVNTATSTYRPGQTRLGGALDIGLGPDTQVQTQLDYESNVGTAPLVSTNAQDLLVPGQQPTPGSRVDNGLLTASIGIQQRIGTATLGFSWVNRDRQDRIAGTSTNSHQFVTKFALPISSDLSFQALNELNLGGASDPLYPTRTALSLNWQAQPGVTVRLAQQFFSGNTIGPGSITSLDTIVDYALGDNTTLQGRYSLLGGFNGITGQAAVGLNHRIILAPGLRLNLGLERVFGDAFNLTAAGQQFQQPYAVGLGASALGLLSGTSYTAGLEYTDNPDFQASTRLEFRDSPGGSNVVFTAAAAGKLSPALTGLLRYEHANFANQTITGALADSIRLKMGLAYRDPTNDMFNGLLSYEFQRNPATTPQSILLGVGNGFTTHTLAAEGIYAPSWQWEFYGKYAMRFSEANLARNLSVSNAIHLVQFRAAYHFAYQWDILGEVRWITQPAASYSETGFALELGYYMTPDLRLGVGYSFGSANDSSFGGSGYRSASGPYLGVTLKVNELFNSFGLQPVSPPQQQESVVTPLTESEPASEPLTEEVTL